MWKAVQEPRRRLTVRMRRWMKTDTLHAIPSAPELLRIHLTGRCNLSCRYCYVDKSVQDLPLSAWLKLLADARAMRVFRLSLSGGEVLCCNYWRDFISEAVASSMRFSLATNGVLLDAAAVNFISETKRCDRVIISLDGTREIHDSMRGFGTFDSAWCAIKRCREAGIKVVPKLTIGKHNFNFLEEIFDFFFHQNSLPPITINIGWKINSRCDGTLPFDDIVIVRNKIESLAKRYSENMLKEGALKSFLHWHDVESGIIDGGRDYSCGGVFTRLTIMENGDIKPCTQHNEVLGNITRDALQKVWLEAPILKAMRNNFGSSLVRYASCKHCRYINHCTGTCPLTPEFCAGKFAENASTTN